GPRKETTMMKPTVFLPCCFVLLAGMAATYGQSMNYGSSRTNGLDLESRRHAVRVLDIDKEQVASQAEYQKELVACPQYDYATCRQAAYSKYLARTKEVEIQRIDENAAHEQNMLEIRKYWIQKGE